MLKLSQPDTLQRLLQQTDKLSMTQQIFYVNALFYIIAHGLVKASQVDKVIAEELQHYPVGLTIKMQVLPHHADFVLQITDNHTFRLVKQSHADVCIYIKHLRIAMLLLSFRESTAQAFANDRMTVDGDIAIATRFVRILNQLQAIILPKIIAKRAIKRYPMLPFAQKAKTASQIYGSLIKVLLIKSV